MMVLGVATAQGIMEVPSKLKKYPDGFSPLHQEGSFKWISATSSDSWKVCTEDFVRARVDDDLRDIGKNHEGRFALEYSGGRVAFFSADEQIALQQVPPKNYYPFVLLCYPEVSVVVKICRKRKCGSLELTTKMLNDRLFTDSKILCGGREFAAHRAVLAAASPVFERMWSTAMSESEKSALEIKDCTPEAVEAMVRYIYTQEVANEADPAQLFELAQKYELQDLATEMGHRILEGLCKENLEAWSRVVHRHAKAGDPEAQRLWDAIYGRLSKDPAMLRSLVEGIL